MKDLLELLAEYGMKPKDALKAFIGVVQEFSLWLTLALAAVLLITFVIVWFKKKEALEGFKKVATGVVIGYAVTLISVILYLQIVRMKFKGELDKNFFLVVGFFVAFLITAVVGLILNKRAPKVYGNFMAIALAVVAIFFIVVMFVIPTAGDDYKPQNSALYYIISAVLILAILALGFFFGKNEGTASETKNLAYAGVCIALSFALSYVKFFSLPMGGSVTLASMFPLMLYAYIFGARRGIFAGVIYGVLQFIQSPQIYQPMQVLLDYPIAFGALGLAGIAKNFKFLKGNMILEIVVGMIIAVLFRYASHVVSGYFVFYTWSTMDNPLVYSIAYNSFTMVDLAIDIAAGVLLFSSKSMRKYVSSINPTSLADI